MLGDLTAAIAAVSASAEPYWAAVEVHGLSASLMEQFGVAYRLWWMWAALTDRYELKLEERPAAVAAMVRAADEWLAVADDETARDAYLERWMFDELGLSRDIGPEF